MTNSQLVPVIAWPFIYEQEGGLQLHGYVPPDQNGNSGVTVAAGIDLGQIKPSDPMLAALPVALRDRLAPYIGSRGKAAEILVRNSHLVVTAAEADLMMAEKKRQFIASVTSEFDHGALQPYATIPEGPATAIMSVTWQYGDPWKDEKCGAFWSIAQTCDWPRLAAYLMDAPTTGQPCFPDRRFAGRRSREGHFIILTTKH
jgi:hypothetical protein